MPKLTDAMREDIRTVAQTLAHVVVLETQHPGVGICALLVTAIAGSRAQGLSREDIEDLALALIEEQYEEPAAEERTVAGPARAAKAAKRKQTPG
jgi:hypothetical protein